MVISYYKEIEMAIFSDSTKEALSVLSKIFMISASVSIGAALLSTGADYRPKETCRAEGVASTCQPVQLGHTN